MCEFNVILNGKILCKDIIYAKQEGVNVIVKDIMGMPQEFKSSKIHEIDVPNARLVLVPA